MTKCTAELVTQGSTAVENYSLYLLLGEGDSAFKSLRDHGFTAAWAASFFRHPSFLGFPPLWPDTAFNFDARSLWGPRAWLKGQHTLKCFESSLVEDATSPGLPGEGTQHTTCVCMNGRRQLSLSKVMVVSARPNPCCFSLAFAYLEKSLSPCVAVQAVPVALTGNGAGKAVCACFGGGDLFLGLLFTLLLIHSLLSNDNDLKIISFYFPQIPPIVEVSFFFIAVLIWTPCILFCLPGIWKGEISKYGMPRLNKARSFQLDLQCLCYSSVAKITKKP